MTPDIKYVHRALTGARTAGAFGIDTARRVRAYHETFPEYAPTPLVSLSHLANALGVAGVYVKDESARFGLNAFKGLGGSYAIGCCIGERLGLSPAEISFEALTAPAAREKLGTLTFLTATDGNHGRGVAWTANRLGHRSIVYLPQGSAEERLHNIRLQGAEAEITALNYDDTVRFARQQAEERGAILVQDTTWDGYETIPTHIMQGYTTIGIEAADQLPAPPTHIFLQAGVGAMAGAMSAFFSDCYRGNPPIITIVEPHNADCIFRTAQANDGTLHTVGGSLRTIMAGLACGEPCPIAWELMARNASEYVSIPDSVAAKGMRVLGNPLPGDPAVISGESGASAFGFAIEVLQKSALHELCEALQLDGNSRILCISTEGATDRANYRDIVWDGLCPSF